MNPRPSKPHRFAPASTLHNSYLAGHLLITHQTVARTRGSKQPLEPQIWLQANCSVEPVYLEKVGTNGSPPKVRLDLFTLGLFSWQPKVLGRKYLAGKGKSEFSSQIQFENSNKVVEAK